MGRLTNEERERRAAAVREVEDAVRTEGASGEVGTDATTEKSKPAFQAYSPTGENVRTQKGRMSFTLTSDGEPDFASMRTNQRDFFRKVLSNPSYKNQLGIADPSEQLPVFTEADIRALYTMLGPVEAYGIALALKCPVALASKVFTYTEDDLVLLTQPTLALANKYSAYLGSYAKWKEEITFAMVFIAVTQKKLGALRHEIAKLKQEQENNPAFAPLRTVEEQPARVDMVPDVSNGETVDGFAVAGGTQ